MKPKAIILDLGNVVLELDWDAALRALNLDNTEPGAFFFHHIQTWPPYDLYERGKVSTTEFLEHVSRRAGKTFTEEKFSPAWEKIVKGYFPGVVNKLQQVAEAYPLYALTNTNPIHLHMLRTKYPELKVFRELFNSVDLAIRKPEPEIYSACEKAIGVLATEIVYVDDNQANVTAAQAIGWQAKLCTNGGEELIAILDRLD